MRKITWFLKRLHRCSLRVLRLPISLHQSTRRTLPQPCRSSGLAPRPGLPPVQERVGATAHLPGEGARSSRSSIVCLPSNPTICLAVHHSGAAPRRADGGHELAAAGSHDAGTHSGFTDASLSLSLSLIIILTISPLPTQALATLDYFSPKVVGKCVQLLTERLRSKDPLTYQTSGTDVRPDGSAAGQERCQTRAQRPEAEEDLSAEDGSDPSPGGQQPKEEGGSNASADAEGRDSHRMTPSVASSPNSQEMHSILSALTALGCSEPAFLDLLNRETSSVLPVRIGLDGLGGQETRGSAIAARRKRPSDVRGG